MRIHYDHTHHAYRIESPALAWLVDHVRPRVWRWLFVVAYVVCVCWLVVELARWMGGR